MAKNKVCIVCGEKLYCKECGASQTPKKNWRRTTMQFSPGQIAELDAAAKEAGISRAELVRNLVGRVLDIPAEDDCESEEN